MARGAMKLEQQPAVLRAPGRTRPMMFSHNISGLSTSAEAQLMLRSLRIDIQKSGGMLRKLSPKKPLGATPTIVTAVPFMPNADPITDGSAAYFCCQVL
jgi:hypothetical protein